MRIVLKHQFLIKNGGRRGASEVVASETNFRRPLNYMGGGRLDQNEKVVYGRLRRGGCQNFGTFFADVING